jgi:hypothetical protein
MAELAREIALASPTAKDLARGLSEAMSPILEFVLPNGRRLDVAALAPDGTIVGVEIKISLAGLRADD